MAVTRPGGSTTGGREFKQGHTMDREVVGHCGQGLEGVTHRGRVERPFAGVSTDRCHARDDDVLGAHREATVQISPIGRWLKRMA